MGPLQEFIDEYMVSRQPVACLPSGSSSTAEDPLGVEDDQQTQQDFATFASWLTSLEAERAAPPVIPNTGLADESIPVARVVSPPASSSVEQRPAALPLPPSQPSNPECSQNALCTGQPNCIKASI